MGWVWFWVGLFGCYQIPSVQYDCIEICQYQILIIDWRFGFGGNLSHLWVEMTFGIRNRLRGAVADLHCKLGSSSHSPDSELYRPFMRWAVFCESFTNQFHKHTKNLRTCIKPANNSLFRSANNKSLKKIG